MVSKRRPVGIDIEQIKQKVERIAHKFMRPTELAFIDDQHKLEQMYVCWCAKEAVYKCYGQKEVSFLDDITLHPFDFNAEGQLNADLRKGKTSLNYSVNYLQYEDYMIGYVKG
jgi:phosphopantetheine--protein transferase-like protein